MNESAIRRAAAEDLERATETLWLAFADDPLWRWAFPDHAKLRPWWRMLVASALQHRWVWTIEEFAAVAVWIPPGCDELSSEDEAAVPGLMQELVGERAVDVMALIDEFDSSHPHDPPHYYLSLLGTHPAHRGRGLGVRLVTENLRLIDAEGAPAYLESSNAANEPRYEALGFARNGSFTTPDGAREVVTMWRRSALS